VRVLEFEQQVSGPGGVSRGVGVQGFVFSIEPHDVAWAAPCIGVGFFK
jgi:hypothetical protein